MSLPEFHAPERGSRKTHVDESIGKVVINGELFNPEDANNFAHDLIAAAQFASKQGTCVSEGDSFPPDGSIRLTREDGAWDSTFPGTVAHLLRDLLRDQPTEIGVLRYNQEGDEIRTHVAGLLVEVTEQESLLFEDGYTLPVDDVLGLVVLPLNV